MTGRAGYDTQTIARFLAKINPLGPVVRADLGSCWLWTANRVKGYGQFTLPHVNGKRPYVYAHRLAYELTYGPLTGPHQKACHRCDHTLCVRPDHLFAGTQADNLSDCRAKGRMPSVRHRKLSEAAVRDIRARYRRGNGAQLGREYGVTKSHVSLLVRELRKPALRETVLERVPHVQLLIRGVLHVEHCDQPLSGSQAKNLGGGLC